ncbi:unnamed protein product [Rotaria sp. Silwood2]|nr:unnamed protein product [Rotaria sp. Silwood2]CAF2880072.1 unnamed protein product [Rotaria sp. Silwood2]CAF3142484.1 unnamed protein product [Rotaria sp. Silwood2]CAF3296492.1 unnamed protein product [Rotaria sp. Silwood2]CAF4273550.1 unnamed protein product [Rotaria sp. Silwood2]
MTNTNKLNKALWTNITQLKLSNKEGSSVRFLLDKSPFDENDDDETSMKSTEYVIIGRILPNSDIFKESAFQIEIKLTSNYPFEPPEVRFLTPIYHPNIDKDGKFCHPLLTKTTRWKHGTTLIDVVKAVVEHIDNPDIDYSVNAGLDDDLSDSVPPTRPCNWVPIREQYLCQPRRLKIITIGAGFSGLTLAYKVQNQCKLDDRIEHVIYEKNPDIGGTWYQNRYPGVGCDIPAHIYSFIWEPNPDWSSFCVGGPEIFTYIKRTADKYNLTKNIQFNSKVVEAQWNEADGKWHIKIEQNGKIIRDIGDLLINACGVFNTWKWPDVDGLNDFQGHLVHSAQWKDGYDFQGKNVGLIGNGASAIQILPKIQPFAAHVTCFVRNPTWISPPILAEFAKSDGQNIEYTEEQKAEFRSNPKKLLEMRKTLEHAMNKFFGVYIKDSEHQLMAQKSLKEFMLQYLQKSEELATLLIPQWSVGCRRITPNNQYLEAIIQTNVTVKMCSIDRFTKTGLQTANNEHYELDAIICATGFDVSYCPPLKLIGSDGVDLAQTWKTNPAGYFGIAAHGFPNYFIFIGPNTPVAQSSLTSCIDWEADYILKWAKKIQEEDIHSVDVTQGAVDDFNSYAQEFMERTVWKEHCRSWYKSGKVNGNVTAPYPGSALHYKEMLDELRPEDFDIKYNTRNRFSFMGNGFTKRESLGEDLSYYLEK